MNVQLPLGLGLTDHARFDNFCAGPNLELWRNLQACALGDEPGPLFFWGEPGSGKSHLLQAACREAGASHRAAAYVPLGRHAEFSPGVLAGLEDLALACLDDVQQIAGRREWEEALFDLFNRLRERGVPLVAAARRAPFDLQLELDDLASRLGWGLVYALQPLSDAQRLEVLQMRAQGRGLVLPEETGRFLLRRYPRDLPTLCGLLDRLDAASLVAQRRLTVPFVKEILPVP